MTKKRFSILLLAVVLLVSFTAPMAQASQGNGRGGRYNNKVTVSARKHKTNKYKNRYNQYKNKHRQNQSKKRNGRSRRVERVPDIALLLGGLIIGGIILNELNDHHTQYAPSHKHGQNWKKHGRHGRNHKFWKRGHYNRRGYWIPGHWE